MRGRATGPNGARTNGTAPPIGGATIRGATNGPTPAGPGGAVPPAPPGATAAAGAARDESTGDARRVTGVLARAVVTPNLSDALLHGDPRAIRRLDAAIVGRVTGRLAAIVGRVTGRLLVRVKLWLLRDLVHAAGGTLDVVSSPGAGTRVRLEVPQR
jgi:hypothetical protein